MKKILLAILGLAFASIIFLAIRGNNMQEIETEIEIAAPPAKVWSIITDIDKWQEWSPIINVSQGNSAIGSKLSITMISKEKGKDGPKYNPVITELKEQKYFHWRAHMLAGFIFTNDKIFRLEETGTGTHLIHIETFKGLMAPLMSGSVEKNVPSMLNSMNKALKELAEK
ncbi:MAG: SRPBCC domain-containing protein [Proteobacteria bacterium]|nr:SRPBCC domain-containing protein [Pseudomonadota bacterium]